jgi:hypothetical protein
MSIYSFITLEALKLLAGLGLVLYIYNNSHNFLAEYKNFTWRLFNMAEAHLKDDTGATIPKKNTPSSEPV